MLPVLDMNHFLELIMNVLDELKLKAGKFLSFAGRFYRELPSLFEMDQANEKSIEILATYFLKQHLRCISILSNENK
jgi:hypothetical protein